MNRHPVRWGSALTGLTFLAVAAAWAVLELDVVDVEGAGPVVAVALIVLGVIGIAATVVVARRPHQPPVPHRPDPDPDPDHTVPSAPSGETLEEDHATACPDRPTDPEGDQR